MRGTIHARKTIRGSIGYPTLKGEPGEDGYSPQASVTKTGNTATITITDKSGTTTAQVTDGAKGDPGQDGISPSATVAQTANGATITITDKTGTTTATVTNGQDGDDGYSPSASVSKSGRIATITVTDKTGTTTAQVSDGQDGTPAIIDAMPTEDSPNAVSSGGVYDELSDLKSDLNDLSDSVADKYEKPSTGIPASDLASGVIPDVSGKADKVQSATLGNFASLDSNGNLVDSGHKHSDYLTQHQDISGKADKVQNATSGNFASLDANGNLMDSGHKHSDYLTEAPVTDVQVDGTSVVANGVAEIPLTTGANDIGLVKVRNNTDGLYVASNGYLAVARALSGHIKDGTNSVRPIMPHLQHESTFYGLAKAAGDTTQSSSSNAVGTYTDDAKIAIQKMLGIYEAPWELIRSDTVTNESLASIDITVDDNGSAFELTDIILKFWIPSSATGSSKGDYGRVYCYNNQFEPDYFYMQGLNSENKTAYGKIEQRKNFLEVTFTRGVTINDETMNYGTLRLPTNSNSAMYKIINSTRFYNRIVITDVTGTASYILYGKRRWQ